MRSRLLWLFVLPLITVSLHASAGDAPLRVGSKKFTESVILGEVLRQLVESESLKIEHRAELGGTRILWNAIVGGDIDFYPEYTGTLSEELLKNENARTPDEMQSALAKYGLKMTRPLGFNNTYALGMRESLAEKLKIESISDLRAHPELRLGLSAEFKQREDGWPRVRRQYNLPQTNVKGLDHDVAYRALVSDEIDLVDLYSTDAEIAYYKLRVLRDDRAVFPRYDAVILYRSDLESRAPRAVEAARKLEGLLNESTMVTLNARAKIDRVPEAQVAAEFIRSRLGVDHEVARQSVSQSILKHLIEHLNLVVKSMLLALIVAIPLGVASARNAAAAQMILSVVGLVQTIPALALLVLLIQPLKSLGLPGIGNTPAIVALFLYSLLPIVRNTYTGLKNISPDLAESAQALGLSSWQRLRLVEIPLASPHILAGIKTAVVINVGFATLGALVGAGGFGQPILTGIRLDNYSIILQGAVPAALLAWAFQLAFDLVERLWVPRGLRLKR